MICANNRYYQYIMRGKNRLYYVKKSDEYDDFHINVVKNINTIDKKKPITTFLLYLSINKIRF